MTTLTNFYQSSSVTQDFNNASKLLEGLFSETINKKLSFQFSKEFEDQHPIHTALKVLNSAVLTNEDQNKNYLLESRDKIKALNSLLKNETLPNVVRTVFGIEMNETEAEKIKGIQIAVPKTKFERMMHTATKIPRVVCTILLDLALLPGALAVLIAACCKVNFNPREDKIKHGKTPILMLHGSGFNESEWIVGRQFLKKEKYGSIFSMNYDGLISNDPKMGIDDYAREKIRAEVQKIKRLTGSDNVILMGHSMGGLIAGYYAEHYAVTDNVKVDHIISIATPWRGSPIVDWSWKLGGLFSKENETKRHQQMSVDGGTTLLPKFRQSLVASALSSERAGNRKYYSIWSSTDFAVPKNQGCLSEDPRRQRAYSYLGHYSIIASPSVWLQTRKWLDEIYT